MSGGDEIPAWGRDGMMQIPVRAGEWVKAEFWGWVPREGVMGGATVYLRVETAPMLERLREAMHFTEARDLRITSGKLCPDNPDPLPPPLQEDVGT